MFEKYFNDFSKKIIGKDTLVDPALLREKLAPLIPSSMSIEPARIVDMSGYSPDGTDLVVYSPYCQDIVKLMGGYVPCELVRAALFMTGDLTRPVLAEILPKVAAVKTLNEYQSAEESETFRIPCIVIATGMPGNFMELKNDIVNYYISKNVPHLHELDTLIVLDRGVVNKNWREKRSFTALETKEDTGFLFYILLSDALSGGDTREFELRNYVKKNVVYSEY